MNNLFSGLVLSFGILSQSALADDIQKISSISNHSISTPSQLAIGGKVYEILSGGCLVQAGNPPKVWFDGSVKRGDLVSRVQVGPGVVSPGGDYPIDCQNNLIVAIELAFPEEKK